MNSKGQTVIFIVEDNFMCSYLLDTMLRDHGIFKITTFESGEKCLESLKNNPDLIVLDYNLGQGMNGMETLKMIRKQNLKVPVIMLSAQNDKTLAKQLLDAGANDYIDKQNIEHTLEKLIRSITELKLTMGQ